MAKYTGTLYVDDLRHEDARHPVAALIGTLQTSGLSSELRETEDEPENLYAGCRCHSSKAALLLVWRK
jgi:hypothetical protein